MIEAPHHITETRENSHNHFEICHFCLLNCYPLVVSQYSEGNLTWAAVVNVSIDLKKVLRAQFKA